ncbi:MAG: hypothetical protein J7L38_02460 [Thermoproteales archaeon]|nr:hypothetical protein [Thermoproteales archaeon]
MENRRFWGYNWYGIIPPQYILANKRFLKVVLEPPDLNPGSWRGAGKVLVDYENHEFWLTTRPRKAYPVRGYALEIYRSSNGEDFHLAAIITREELSEETGVKVKSIEGQQLLKDPSTDKYHLYVSVDNEGFHDKPGWDTILLKSDDPRGPWEYHGVVLSRGDEYDTLEARDATIDIIDGMYLALYKANNGSRVNMALAISTDGVTFHKLGVMKLDGGEQPKYMLLCGKIFSGSFGPTFVGFDNRVVIRNAAVTDTFSAYILDLKNLNLVQLFTGKWVPQSPFERKDYPAHSYVDIVYDPFKNRLLLYVEAIDPSDIGLNNEIDRVLLYEVPL